MEAAVRAFAAEAAAEPDSDPDDYCQLSLPFHACVATASGNRSLPASLKTCGRLLARYRARYRFAGAGDLGAQSSTGAARISGVFSG